MKQTAVDILYKFLYEMESFEGFDPYNFNQEDVFNKAKEMEKEQMIEFAEKCLDKALDLDVRTAYIQVGQYYNETFKSE